MNVSSLSLVALALRAVPAGARRLAAEPRPGCADTLAERDCRDVKQAGQCYVYAEECAATCGCDVDWAKERKRQGLDDAHYASPDFRCVTGAAFADGQKFNCTLYEGARWCAVDAAGDVVEGPGWCSWFDPDDCDVERDDRWADFEWYANDKGQWAKSCCCDTGLAETYPYEGGGDCVDHLNSRGGTWHDSNGYSCRAYHFGSFCTKEGAPGSGWKAYEGNIADYAHDGTSALEACCACGQHPPGTITSPPTATSTAAATTPAPTTSAPTTGAPTTGPPTTLAPNVADYDYGPTGQDAAKAATSRL